MNFRPYLNKQYKQYNVQYGGDNGGQITPKELFRREDLTLQLGNDEDEVVRDHGDGVGDPKFPSEGGLVSEVMHGWGDEGVQLLEGKFKRQNKLRQRRGNIDKS